MAKKKAIDSFNLQKAYKNADFLNSPAARNIRILTEMVEPETRFRRHRVRDTVVFFGSARTLPGETARANLTNIEKQMNDAKNGSSKLKLNHEIAQRDLIMSRYYDDHSFEFQVYFYCYIPDSAGLYCGNCLSFYILSILM